jgi:LAO/AO transport system kinase
MLPTDRYTLDEVIGALRSRDRRMLARCCSLAESTLQKDREFLARIIDALPASPNVTRRIAITGSPGVGKSSLIEKWGFQLIEQGHSVAVMAIDPSSRRTGGSILGDKTRMPRLSNARNAFVRPQPSGTHLGGTSSGTRASVILCEAAGFDTIIIETVGVGQSEVEVADIVDVCLLLTLPTAGDEVQAIKRGIMEVSDIIAVMKSDIEPHAARHASALLQGAVRMLRPFSEEWLTRVVIANAVEETGLDDLNAAVTEFFRHERRDAICRRRERQMVQWFDSALDTMFREMLLHREDIRHTIEHERLALVNNKTTVPIAVLHVEQTLSDILQWKNDQ